MHQHSIRIYYEDTDAGGVVYYANYLKFAERARTEWLRECGVNQSHLSQEEHVLFVVKRCEIDYHAPAKLDDVLQVQTRLQELGNASISMQQKVVRPADEMLLATINVIIVCVNHAMRPSRIPASVRSAMSQ